jgi:hypothetical protein
MWLQAAALRGEPVAEALRRQAAALNPEQLSQARRRAADWLAHQRFTPETIF